MESSFAGKSRQLLIGGMVFLPPPDSNLILPSWESGADDCGPALAAFRAPQVNVHKLASASPAARGPD